MRLLCGLLALSSVGALGPQRSPHTRRAVLRTGATWLGVGVLAGRAIPTPAVITSAITPAERVAARAARASAVASGAPLAKAAVVETREELLARLEKELGTEAADTEMKSVGQPWTRRLLGNTTDGFSKL
ncbi:hypothetical protein T492DRAFT_1149954 [Pavlovales sp. CCMP2436]|nr:hypothetical protein T492DRAFT_1149954 [Pavlovales sp. CCMP2436]